MGVSLKFVCLFDYLGCSGELTHPTGEISTPGYPYEYPHEIECHWKIRVEFNSSIMLNISEFGFESSVDCMYDSLQVRNFIIFFLAYGLGFFFNMLMLHSNFCIFIIIYF